MWTGHVCKCWVSELYFCRCLTSRELLKHHQKCVNQSCPVCTPVKQYVQKQRMVMQRQQQEAMARKEAEARGGYNPHMMQVLPARMPTASPVYFVPATS